MLTHRAKYAIKALLHLAAHRGEGTVQAAAMAEAESIPTKFLETILVQLRTSGIIRSKVGKGGGHELIKEPKDLLLLDVVRLIDGPIAPLPCLSRTSYSRCNDCADEATCGVRRLFAPAHEAALKQLGRTTLADAQAKPKKKR